MQDQAPRNPEGEEGCIEFPGYWTVCFSVVIELYVSNKPNVRSSLLLTTLLIFS